MICICDMLKDLMSSPLSSVLDFFIEFLIPANISGLSLDQLYYPKYKLLDSDIMDRIVNSSTFSKISSSTTYNTCDIVKMSILIWLKLMAFVTCHNIMLFVKFVILRLVQRPTRVTRTGSNGSNIAFRISFVTIMIHA